MADDGFDNEILKALKFLRKKNAAAADDDNESAAFLSQEVTNAIEIQGEATTAQNAALLEAIREQNVVLNNLLTVLREQEEVAAAAEAGRSTKPKVIYVNKNDEQSKEVVDAIAEAEAAILAKEEKEDVIVAAATATALEVEEVVEEEEATEEPITAASVAAVAAPEVIEEEEEEATEEPITTASVIVPEVEEVVVVEEEEATEEPIAAASAGAVAAPEVIEEEASEEPITATSVAAPELIEDEEEATEEPVTAASVAAVAAPEGIEEVVEEEEATEEPITASTPKEEIVTASVVTPPSPISVKKEGPIVITGPWKFVESDVASKRRNRIKKNGKSDDILKNGDSLFGNVTDSYDEGFDDELQGDSFGKHWKRMRNGVNRYGTLKAPKWSSSDAEKRSIRTYLPKLQIDKETKIKLNSGIYYLKIKYENKYVNNPATATKNGHSMKKCEAAIIIGEIAFDSNGFVLAGGADWEKLFKERQLQPPRAGTNPKNLKWFSSKVSDKWEDGNILTFKIDTDKNTVGFTIHNDDDTTKAVRAGWMFSNVLKFTNNPIYPDHLQVFAYCGGTSLNSSLSAESRNFDDVKFKIINYKKV